MSAAKPALIGIVAGVLSVGSLFGAYTFMGSASRNDAQAKHLLSQIREEGQVDQELDAVSKRLELCNQRLIHIMDDQPEIAVSGLMTRLEQTGNSQGLKVTGVRPKEDALKPVQKSAEGGDSKPVRKDYTEQLIEVKGTGEYDSVRQFIRALEMFPNIVKMESLDITPRVNSAGESNTGSLDITITLRAYLYNPPQEQPSTEKGKSGEAKSDPSAQARLTPAQRSNRNGS